MTSMLRKAAVSAQLAIRLIFCVLPSVAPAANDCGRFYGDRYAFARVGPMETFATDRLQAGRNTEVKFGNKYPVLAVEDQAVRLCIDHVPHWARRSQVLLTDTPSWVVAQEDTKAAERPRIRFWRSQQDLNAHLSEDSAAKAPPDYEEVISRREFGKIRLPVSHQDVLQTSLNTVQLRVASVLVPFLNAAVEDYRRLRLQQQADLILLLDLSGSTAGFVRPLMRRLEAVAASRKSKPRVLIIGIDGDGRHRAAELSTLSKLATHTWQHRPGPVESNHNLINVGFDSAVTRIRGNTNGVPVVVAAGGDVSLDPASWTKIDKLTLVQLTPELEPELGQSATRLGIELVNASHPSSPALGISLAAEPDTRTRPPKPSPSDHDYLVRLTNDYGFITLLPDLADTPELAIPPAFALDDAEWFAVPLWVVIDGLLLQMEQSKP
ncbi:hypothetical protein [Candidatus Thiosymbion oneisti]|uniref:hypothetical protein n=1 Tax=Candidatus Thiosymbion oneisti TaxID=589554 RepID=UPI00105FA9F0|nr:hypothetical protein [Candidatus Thiosymbion oneisti]